MPELTQEQEMKNAYSQKRQPMCVYCKKLLDEIKQMQDEELVWRWDKKLRQYKKFEEGSAERPYHPACNSADWAFIDERLVNF